jgi:hypothetical protein
VVAGAASVVVLAASVVVLAVSVMAVDTSVVAGALVESGATASAVVTSTVAAGWSSAGTCAAARALWKAQARTARRTAGTKRLSRPPIADRRWVLDVCRP